VKILSAKYDGIEECWTRVKVVCTLAGKRQEGVLLFENDGRDMESEGLHPKAMTPEFAEELDELYADEPSMDLLEPELAKGSLEYYGKG